MANDRFWCSFVFKTKFEITRKNARRTFYTVRAAPPTDSQYDSAAHTSCLHKTNSIFPDCIVLDRNFYTFFFFISNCNNIFNRRIFLRLALINFYISYTYGRSFRPQTIVPPSACDWSRERTRRSQEVYIDYGTSMIFVWNHASKQWKRLFSILFLALLFDYKTLLYYVHVKTIYRNSTA